MHILRHSAAKLRRDAGESIENVSELPRPLDLAVTTVYLRRLEGDSDGVAAERAVAWLRHIGEAIQLADCPSEKADLVHAVYERIVVAGPEFVSARLTRAACPAWLGTGIARSCQERARQESDVPVRTRGTDSSDRGSLGLAQRLRRRRIGPKLASDQSRTPGIRFASHRPSATGQQSLPDSGMSHAHTQ